MALATTSIIQLQLDGSDTLNGGGFDPVGGTMATDLSATLATSGSPVVTSASYTFLSGDVGAWLFIRSGTNWIPGWYQIASVTGGAATLTASIGSGVLYVNSGPSIMSTTLGCATTASPTTGTWSIDYSQQASAQFSLTGLTSAGTGLTILTSAATKAMVGNFLIITGGTNFNLGVYCVTAATAGTSITVVGATNVTTGAGALGTAGLGGGVKSLGGAGAIGAGAAGMTTMWKYNASVYPITVATNNVSGGLFAPTSSHTLCGYANNRCLTNLDANMPTAQASGIASVSIIVASTTYSKNCIIDGNSLTGIVGFNVGFQYNCVSKNCLSSGFASGMSTQCLALSCVTGFSGGTAANCAAIGGTSGFTSTTSNGCIASGCSSRGFTSTTIIENCTAYNCTSDGFINSGTGVIAVIDCISWGNGGKGYNANSVTRGRIANCAAGNNTGINFDPVFQQTFNSITLTANPFVNPTATINVLADVWAAFALNNTAGGGALCRGASVVPYQDLGPVQHQDSPALSVQKSYVSIG